MKQLLTALLLTSAVINVPSTLAQEAAQVESTFKLTQAAHICRKAIDAELYQSQLDVGDRQGAIALIQESGCSAVRAGEIITVTPYDPNEPDNMLGTDRPVYKVVAPVGGRMVDGFIPKAALR